MPAALTDELIDRIRRFGPRPFDELMELALYDPDAGFFATSGAAGRRGDFLTSPEVGPLFGAVLARALDDWWGQLGSPDPFPVIEAGAGAGTLARAILAAQPDCAGALTYVLVERSAVLRSQHERGLPLVPPALAFPPQAVDDEGIARTVEGGHGPRVVSLAELPAGPLRGVILANELLDNLPFRILQRVADGWDEVRIGEQDGRLGEQLVAGPTELVSVANGLAGDAEPGARVPVPRAAASWVASALERLDAGRLVVIDYGASTPELAGRSPGWLRTYRGHERGSDPLLELGEQDITADVALDQLPRIGEANTTDQASFLRSYGIDELVEEGRRVWHERAHLGDLEAIKARSRVREAEALLDAGGLGAFTVIDWSLFG